MKMPHGSSVGFPRPSLSSSGTPGSWFREMISPSQTRDAHQRLGRRCWAERNLDACSESACIGVRAFLTGSLIDVVLVCVVIV